MVKLYALSTCPWCKKTKKLLNENEVQYDFVDVDLAPDDQQETIRLEIRQLGVDASFPIMVVNGEVIVGYNPDEILRAVEHEK